MDQHKHPESQAPREPLEPQLCSAPYQLFEQVAASHPERTALVHQREGHWTNLSFGELDRQAAQVHAALEQRQLAAGASIALCGPAGPDWTAAFLGVLRAGFAVVPVDPAATPLELQRIAALTQPSLWLAEGPPVQALQDLGTKAAPLRSTKAWPTAETPPAVPRDPNKPAVITCTSGTTGAAKAVETSGRALAFQILTLPQVMGFGPDEVFLSVLGPHHLLELVGGLLGVLRSGARVVITPSLHPEDLASTLEQQSVTRVLGVPLLLDAMRRRILGRLDAGPSWLRGLMRVALASAPALPRPLRAALFTPVRRRLGPALDGFIVGGAPLSRSTERFWRALGYEVLQGYGLTETSPVITVNRPGASRTGSVGLPLPGVQLRIEPLPGQGEVGEVLTRGPHVMNGYRSRPDLTAQVLAPDGWLRTGDLGRIDRRGHLFLVGRAKDLVVLPSGKKVHPCEVEEALGSRADRNDPDAWDELCVLGTPARERGEEVCAIVAGIGPLDPALVRRELLERARALAPHKRPTRWLIHPGPLPRTGTRKVRRPDLLSWTQTQAPTR